MSRAAVTNMTFPAALSSVTLWLRDLETGDAKECQKHAPLEIVMTSTVTRDLVVVRCGQRGKESSKKWFWILMMRSAF